MLKNSSMTAKVTQGLPKQVKKSLQKVVIGSPTQAIKKLVKRVEIGGHYPPEYGGRYKEYIR